MTNEIKIDIGRLTLLVKESDEAPAQGIIIDVYERGDDENIVDSFTLWYDEYLDACTGKHKVKRRIKKNGSKNRKS